MTADNTNESNMGQSPEQGAARKSRSRKTAKKSTRGAAAKRSRTAASRRSSGASRSSEQSQGGGASRSSRSSGRGGRSASRSSGSSVRSASRKSGRSSSVSGGSNRSFASRFLSGGRRAAEWAAEGASRAMPLASRGLGDQRMVQRLVDERPYMLGAIGLGIGAMIGMMLPGAFSSRMGGRGSRGRSRSRD